MKRLPLYDRLGRYGVFFDNCDEMQNYLSHDSDSNTSDNLIFIRNKQPIPQIMSSFKYDITQISEQDYDKYLNPHLPIWIMYEDVFDALTKGNYLEVLPKSAEIIPTINCCFRCQQCSYQKNKKELGIWDNKAFCNHSELNMTANNMELFIQRLYKVGVKNVVFTGGGEPLLNQTVTLHGTHIANNLGINTAIYTNGLLLNDTVIEKLKTTSPLLIRISIYGMDEISFSKYTNSDASNFSLIINNVKKLIVAKREKYINSKISLSFLIHPTLFPNMNIIDDFFTKYFTEDDINCISVIRFTPAVDYYTNTQHPKYFFDDILSPLQKLSEKYSKITTIMLYTHRMTDLYKCKEYDTCKANGFFTEISPNGDLYLCCEKLMDKQYVIGNIINDEIIDIYTSERRINIINMVNQEKCMKCPTLCKPHEINKQVNLINNMNIADLYTWRKELLKISKSSPYFAGRFNAFES
jgi:sulfatase maturation enzyme AslB (radical SAM superfamily)